ncbi:hypothetical protein ACFE04_028503 [Oxalis oulophora]
METTSTIHDPNPIPNEPELDLYTIPIHSSWFCWDDIHETERHSLKEFFDAASISRTPKLYKEYRDFIISKYREDPSRRLTFTHVRKSLVGDVSLLFKVFTFLEKWGLINFVGGGGGEEEEEPCGGKVRVEEGPPNGVRVVAMPNQFKQISRNSDVVVGDNGIKQPQTPLASFSDVFGDLGRELKCGSCRESCQFGCYEYSKGNYVLCSKCFKNENFGENRSMEDFIFKGCPGSNNGGGPVWTEAETLLLLESVFKHGDNWDLVAQSVRTKTRLDCILKLIELPFGDFLMRSANEGGVSSSLSLPVNDSLKPVNLSSSENLETQKTENLETQKTENLETQKTENQSQDLSNQTELYGSDEPPSKRQCIPPAMLADDGSLLMKQVARISTMVGPEVAAAAAEAAITVLCDESSCPREIFDVDDHLLTIGTQPCEIERELDQDDVEMKEKLHQSETAEMSEGKNGIPLTLRMRAAIGTAFGAAAAHAKLLAVKEEREIEHLVATIIDAQLKKLDRKMKHIDDLELMMEKEYLEMDEMKERLIAERIDVLHKRFSAGKFKSKDLISNLKSETD